MAKVQVSTILAALTAAEKSQLVALYEARAFGVIGSRPREALAYFNPRILAVLERMKLAAHCLDTLAGDRPEYYLSTRGKTVAGRVRRSLGHA